MDDKKIGSGILADGVGSIVGGLVGSFSILRLVKMSD